MEREELYCYDCKHCLVEEYNEWLEVYCVKNGKAKKVDLFHTCEEVEERD